MMAAKAGTGSMRMLVRNLVTMDQITKVEHRRLLAIESAAKAVSKNIYETGRFGLPTLDPFDLRNLRRALEWKQD
jgi:hypothetical protein